MANLFDVYNASLLIDHTEGEKLETGETPITITGLTAYTTYDKVQVAYVGSYNKSDVPSFKTSPGRNLLLDTGRSFTGIGTNSIHGSFLEQRGIYYLAGGKKVSDLYNQYGSSGYLTLSFDWVASGDTISGQFNVEWGDLPWIGIGNYRLDGLYIQPSNTNKSGHYEATVPLNTDGYATGTATDVRFRQDNLQGNITISNVKLEAGNVATPWIPAPEDSAT